MAFWVVLIKIAKIVLKVREYANLLKGLSSGDLVRGLITTYIISEVRDALARAGIPAGSLRFIEEARNGSGLILDATGEHLQKVLGITVTPADLDQALDREVKRLLQGLSVGNGAGPQRNQGKGADPVLLHRGEFERTSDDLFVRGAGADLLLRRIYRSGADYLGPFGRGWDHSLNLRLTEIDAHTVTRLTGDLSETRFVRHPRFGQAGYDYFTPESGVHEVLEVNPAGGFLLRRPGGGIIGYESAGTQQYRARWIQDAAGNRIDFAYDAENRLRGVYGNGPHRYLRFFYGAFDRIEHIEDHAGRRCTYAYDESGFLSRAEQWSEVAAKPYLTAETYDYVPVGDGHRLARVSDEQGRVLVENDYDTQPASDTFGYVRSQYTEHGPTSFTYERLSPEQPSTALREVDMPALRVFEVPPDGHVIERVFNEAGNELLRREDYVEGGRIRTAVLRTRYNEDGAAIARMDPEGGLTQCLLGREYAALGAWNDFPSTLNDVTADRRLSFGNELAKIERGRAMPELDRVAEQEQWIAALPDVRVRVDDTDAIVKQVFDSRTQVLLSTSDVRATASPDPLHVESAPPGTPSYNPGHPLAKAHHSLLVSHEYTPSGLRIKTRFPPRSRPPSIGGPQLADICDEMTAWDSRGRPLARRDRRGHVTYWQYYPDHTLPAAGAKAGYPRCELRPHTDWILAPDFPRILEVQRTGPWTSMPLGFVAAGGTPASIRLELCCQRIELWRSSDKSSISACHAAAVTVDGAAHGTWDQTGTPVYLITDLAPGPHLVEISAATGALALGRVIGHVSFTFDVDVLGRVVAETNPRGVTTRTVYDALDRVIERTRGVGASMTCQRSVYDRDGELERKQTEWRDSAGEPVAGGVVETRYQRNNRRLVALEVTRAPGHTDRRVTRFYHDLLGVLVAARSGRGVMTRWRVDVLGRRVRETRGACTDEEATTTITHDRCGRVLQGRDAEGAIRVNGIRSGGGVRSGYDARGRLRFATDPLGNLTVTRHDLAGRETVVQLFARLADGTFELAERHEIEHDEHGDRVVESTAIISRPVHAADPIDKPDAAFLDGVTSGAITMRTTSYELDADGRRRRIADGSRVTALAYDPQGRVIDERLPTGRRIARIYDGAGNPVRAYAFDPAAPGDPSIRAATFFETYRHDDHDRRTEVQDAYGNTWREAYDTLGNIETSIDPLGHRVERRYNAFGQEIQRTEGLTDDTSALPATTSSTYDFCGNLVTLTDALGRRFTFSYNALDLRTSWRNASYPADPGSIYAYDRCGRLVREHDRNGLVHHHQYDGAGRRVRTEYDAAAVSPAHAPQPPAATFVVTQYDARGATVRLENDWAIVTQTRDSRGLILEERTELKPSAGVGSLTWRVAQSFDAAGARTELVYPTGRVVTYQRDDAGRVTLIGNAFTPAGYPGSSLTIGNAALATYTYAGGRWVGADYPAAKAALTVEHDGRGQVIQRALTDTATGTILWRQQTLLNAARRTALETTTTTAGGRSRHFVFDALGRLTGYTDAAPAWIDPLIIAPAVAPVAAATPSAQSAIDAMHAPGPPADGFHFDAVGNRLSSQEGGAPAVISTPDADNRYTTVEAAAWSYDGEARLIEDEARRYAYDAEGLLAAEGDLAAGDSLVKFVRDPLGRIVIARTTTGDHRFAYLDEQTPLTHWHAAGLTEYTPGGPDREPVHIASAGEDEWITTDAVCTPRVLLRRGLVPALMILDQRPYGTAASSAGMYAFAGMLRYPGSAVLHGGHRSYLPEVGRFMQQDPAGFVDGPNRYVYARNNPIDLYDPLGLQTYSPLTKSRLEFIANARGIGAGKFGVNQERCVGRWFQNTLLRSYGLTENGNRFASSARMLATENGRTFVVPDAVSDIRYYQASTSATQFRRGLEFLAFELGDIGGKTFKDSTFWEFKALKEGEVINLGDSETQIKGMIDAASETAATKDRRAPTPSTVHLVTTAGVLVSPEVVAYATAKDVELVHHTAEEYISQEGESRGVRVGAGIVLNDIVLLRRGAVIVEQHAGRVVYFEAHRVRINLIAPRFIR